MKRRYYFLIFLLLFFAKVAEGEIQHETFISIADIHFDPFAMCRIQPKPCPFLLKLRNNPATSWGKIFEGDDHSKTQFLQDSNYRLLKNAMHQLKKVDAKVKPKFVLVLGDFLAHDFRATYKKYSNNSLMGYQDFVRKTMIFLSMELKKSFPNTEVFPVIGNNDSYHEDYYSEPYSIFYKDLAYQWTMLLTKESENSFKKTFLKGGYYAISLPALNHLKLIMLNSVLFSSNAKGKNIEKAAKEELEWLAQELSQAEKSHQKVWIAMHIPLGLDFYTAVQTRFSKVLNFWRQKDSEKFRELLKYYPNVITSLLPAHLHYDINQLVLFNQSYDIPINFTPSISPVFGNTPSFKIFTFDPRSFLITNVDTYYFSLKQDLSEWQIKHTIKLKPLTAQLTSIKY